MRDMIFGVARIVFHVGRYVPLRPGDIVGRTGSFGHGAAEPRYRRPRCGGAGHQGLGVSVGKPRPRR
nr:MAG: hypothetical protein DIU74_04930 [Pseudomonadota bacterium]